MSKTIIDEERITITVELFDKLRICQQRLEGMNPACFESRSNRKVRSDNRRLKAENERMEEENNNMVGMLATLDFDQLRKAIEKAEERDCLNKPLKAEIATLEGQNENLREQVDRLSTHNKALVDIAAKYQADSTLTDIGRFVYRDKLSQSRKEVLAEVRKRIKTKTMRVHAVPGRGCIFDAIGVNDIRQILDELGA